MSEHPIPIETAADALHRLAELRFELALAAPAGLADNTSYMHELEDDIAASTELFIGLAVTEIATLRGEVGPRLRG
jgi:hypothetical protein